MLRKVYLLWLQGWHKAPWLQRQVFDSWKINNPKWDIELIDFFNLENYVNDIDYIYDTSKLLTPQAKSDIIRLSILKNHGGVWADSTLLCMQPLEEWINEAIKNNNIWMYHGHGAYLNSYLGPASWFIIARKNGYVISKWKDACDEYWRKNNFSHNYFWMDEIFKNLLVNDYQFKSDWLSVFFVNICCSQ